MGFRLVECGLGKFEPGFGGDNGGIALRFGLGLALPFLLRVDLGIVNGRAGEAGIRILKEISVLILATQAGSLISRFGNGQIKTPIESFNLAVLYSGNKMRLHNNLKNNSDSNRIRP